MTSILVPVVAVCVGLGVGFGLARALAPLAGGGGAPARWARRAAAVVAATVACVGVFHATGQAALLSKRGVASPWRADLGLAIVVGLAYTVVWFVRDPDS